MKVIKNQATRRNIYETATKSRHNNDVSSERERQRRLCLGSECLRRKVEKVEKA